LQVLTDILDICTDDYCKGVLPMSEEEERELVYRVASGDVEAKLELVKEHLDLVVEVAAGYTTETGRSFSQMVQIGTLAVIKAVNEFHHSQETPFIQHVRCEITKAMEGVV